MLCSLQYQDYVSTHGEYLAGRKAYLVEGKHPTLYDDAPSEMRDAYRFLSEALHEKAIERARAGGTSSTTVASAIGNIQSEVTFAYGATFSVVAREADGEYEASPHPKEAKRTRKHCPGKAYRPTGVMFCFYSPGSSTGTQMI